MGAVTSKTIALAAEQKYGHSSGSKKDASSGGQQVQDTAKEIMSCTAVNPVSGAYFDLSDLTRLATNDESDFHIRGHDYGQNFTLNLCAPVISTPQNVLDVENSVNVSAYYTTEKGQIVSIGQANDRPMFRGRKLVLEYTDGSPCPTAPNLRRSTLITLSCDRELLQTIAFSFVGQLHECAYFFEARTPHACPKAGSSSNGPDTLGPFAMFAVISFVMASVYVLVISRRRVPYIHACLNGSLSLISHRTSKPTSSSDDIRKF
ncbi:mannose-6-phosphate receptor binding domain-containing protein [Dipodascopsis uninucleata]